MTLGLPEAGMRLIGAPASRKAAPENIVDGQFSGPFVIAAALADGRVDWDSYARLQDPRLRALMGRIVCEQDPEIEAEFPANMAGKVTIAARGARFAAKVVVPKGEPANFLGLDALRAKFATLADPVLGAERAARLAEAVLAIDGAAGIGGLIRLARPGLAAPRPDPRPARPVARPVH